MKEKTIWFWNRHLNVNCNTKMYVPTLDIKSWYFLFSVKNYRDRASGEIEFVFLMEREGLSVLERLAASVVGIQLCNSLLLVTFILLNLKQKIVKPVTKNLSTVKQKRWETFIENKPLLELKVVVKDWTT